MKKFLLSMAVLAAAASASAANFTVSYEGKEVKDGDVVTVDKYFEVESGMMSCDYVITNTSGAEISVNSGFTTGKLMEVDGEEAYMLLCYEQLWDKQGNCLPDTQGDWTIPAGEGLEIQLHYFCAGDAPAVGQSDFNVFVKEGASSMNFKVQFNSPDPAGVAAIGQDEAAPVYYNLQGVQVANPDKGIYLVKRGSKVTKEVR